MTTAKDCNVLSVLGPVFLLCLSTAVTGVVQRLTEQEAQITFLLAHYFHGSSCIVAIKNKSQKYWPNHGFEEKHNCLLSVLTYDQILTYLIDMKIGEKNSRKAVIALKDESDSFSSLRQISANISLSSAIWIMFARGPVEKDGFRGIYLPFHGEFIYVHQHENTYLLTEIYQIKKFSEIEMYSLGFWDRGRGLVIREHFLYRRRNNLNGNEFGVFVKAVPPYVVEYTGSDGIHEYAGFMYEIWKEMERGLNFSSLIYSKSSELISMSDDLPFVATPVMYNHSTLDRMDITFPIHESRTYLFGHRPGSELQWNSYLKPFDKRTWWASLAWVACSSVSLAVMYKVAWSYGTSEREVEYFTFTLSKSFDTVFRAVCMQGSDVTPQSNSCRLLFLSIYLTALVVSSAFSAALFSLLTIPTSRAPFHSFEEVINNNGFKMGFVQNGKTHQLLSEFNAFDPNSIHSKLLSKVLEKEGFFTDLSQGLNALCHNKNLVLISDLPFVLYVMQNMDLECQEKIMPAGPVLHRNFIGFGLQKGCPFRELIDLQLLKLRNYGIMTRLLLNTWPARIPTVQATWMRITLADISPVLYMFLLGVIIGIILLIIERAIFHLFRKGVKKESKPQSPKYCSKSETKGKEDNF